MSILFEIYQNLIIIEKLCFYNTIALLLRYKSYAFTH